MPNIEVCGRTRSGTPIRRVTLESPSLRVSVLDFGAVLEQVLWKPQKGGLPGPVPLTLSYPRPEDYEHDPYYCGSFIGRTAGRIGRACYEVQDTVYRLSANWRDAHHLHGGSRGFSHRPWTIDRVVDGPQPAVTLQLCSLDGEEGHPGRLEVTLTYSLIGQTLDLVCEARVDRSTHINLTSHMYLNLSGALRQTIGDHHLHIDAQSVLSVDADLIPTGDMEPLAGGPLDFAQMRRLKETALDHSFVLRSGPGRTAGELAQAATLLHPASGLGCHLLTNQPTLHVYSGDYLSDPFIKRGGICLEAQHAPDACHHPHFDSTLLLPNDDYCYRAQYAFFCESTD